MGASIEEEELTAQRDAAVSVCKGLQDKVRSSEKVSKSCGGNITPQTAT